jgi:hypothetical protein
MTIAVQRLCEGLEMDLCLTRLEHLAVRKRLEVENTPENRAAEAECRTRLDVILDLLVELTDRPAGRAQARQWHLPAPGPTG